jgi:ferredoxin-NADP reductase
MSPVSDRFIRATISSGQEVANGLWVIRVDHDGQFRFVAGQRATLGLATPHGLIESAYPIVSSPGEPELEFVGWAEDAMREERDVAPAPAA